MKRNKIFVIGATLDVNGSEIVLQGTVLNRYRSLKNGKILYEDFFPHGSVLLRQSRHIRHNEVGSKNRNEEQQFYAQYQNIICPSCGAEITLKGDERTVLIAVVISKVISLIGRQKNF